MAKKGYTKRRDQLILELIGDNIRFYREQRKLTGLAFAHMCECEPKLIYNYENAKVEFSVSMLSVIATQLGMELHELLKPRQDYYFL